jgi:antitoxin (DNA-binding transcriptional repressor) of toxin-antitoxin stability system
MKEMTLDKFVKDPMGTVEAAQQERIVVTREGEPLAVVVGLQFKDAEDLAYEASPEFWAMIRETRKRPTVRLDDVRGELLRDDADNGKQAS